jgi:hypothetical protein
MILLKFALKKTACKMRDFPKGGKDGLSLLISGTVEKR